MSQSPAAIMPNPAHDPAELAGMLGSFNELVERLQGTHEMLRSQVARLNEELGETKRRLRRSQELAALGEMAAGIAHEIRNPLGSIKLYASMLDQDLGAMPAQQDIAQKIGRAVTGLDSIVSDVLDFARETTLTPAWHDVQDLYVHAIESCRSQLDAAEAQIAVRVDAGTQAWCDRAMMHRALVNVVRNAAQAVAQSSGAARQVILRGCPGYVRSAQGEPAPATALCIEDTGQGISRDVIDRMFNPFFTTRQTGTGLGLAIVHRIVDAHNGSVEVSNRPEGGACVCLVLPTPLDTAHSHTPSKDAAHENRTGS